MKMHVNSSIGSRAGTLNDARTGGLTTR